MGKYKFKNNRHVNIFLVSCFKDIFFKCFKNKHVSYAELSNELCGIPGFCETRYKKHYYKQPTLL